MKIKQKILIFIILITTIANTNCVFAITYFSGENLLIYNDGIEIVSNEVIIDTVNSNVSNIFILKNTSNVQTKETLKLCFYQEPNINTLKILSNGSNAEYIKEDNLNYNINVTISPNSYKKIELYYETLDKLKDVKTIKYSLDNYKGKHIDKFNVKIIIDEIDIPLIKAIYPYNYEFEDNTIEASMYDFTVNNLNKNVIVEKETYRNLMYGDVEPNEIEKFILNNSKELINGDYKINYENYMKEVTDEYSKYDFEIYAEDILKNISNLKYNKSQDEWEYYEMNYFILRIFTYALQKNCNKKNTSIYCYRIETTGYEEGNTPIYTPYNELEYKNTEQRILNVCVDFAETHQGEKLYAIINHYGSEFGDAVYGEIYEKYYSEDREYSDEEIKFIDAEHEKLLKEYEEKYLELTEKTEFDILKTAGVHDNYNFFRFIWIGMDIDGSKIEATTEEKNEYINKMNADFCLRKILYDYDSLYGEPITSYYDKFYYNDEDYEYIESISEINESILTESKKINDNTVQNIEIPVLAFSALYKTKDEQGRSIVSGCASFSGGTEKTYKVVEKIISTNRAKKLLDNNKSKNENIKNNIEQEISNITYNINDIDDKFTRDELTNNLYDGEITIEQIGFIIIIILILVFFILFIVSIKKNRYGE